jgi:hypothetical protein
MPSLGPATSPGDAPPSLETVNVVLVIDVLSFMAALWLPPGELLGSGLPQNLRRGLPESFPEKFREAAGVAEAVSGGDASD